MRALIAALVVFTTLGCSSSSRSLVNSAAADHAFASAYLVTHGGRSSDLDAHIQRELMALGISVAAGAEVKPPSPADFVVRYVDDWGWDMAMYLKRLDIQFVDPDSGTILASGGWKNAPLHGFQSAEGVVRRVLAEMFAKIPK